MVEMVQLTVAALNQALFVDLDEASRASKTPTSLEVGQPLAKPRAGDGTCLVSQMQTVDGPKRLA